MLGRMNLLAMTAVCVSFSLLAPAALAQEDDADAEAEQASDGDDAGTAGEDGEPDTAQGPAAEEQRDQPGEWAVGEDVGDDSPVEHPGKTYYFAGLRYRGIVVPKFMMNLFGDGGDTVYVHGLGPELAVRKDGFEYQFALWWAGYYMDPTPFKASNDPPQAWEIVESEINVMYLTADFLWSHEFSPEFALNYGLGAGVGLVWGALYRTQAYPTGDAGDPYSYAPCSGPGIPNGEYCQDDNDHYDGYDEPSWTDGSKPVIFPWFALQTGFRVKPHRNFVGRIDLGFGITGFYFGVGADYGI